MRRYAAHALTPVALATAVLVPTTPWTSTPSRPDTAPVLGSVTFRGTAPAAAAPDMTGHPFCLDTQPGAAPSQPVAVGDGGALRDVVVYVREAPSGERPAATTPAVLDQVDCQYAPAVVALGTGQALLIRNSDATLHNVHAYPSENRGFNIGQPLRGLESTKAFDRAEVGIAMRCDIHRWMSAEVHVFDHPYFAVTGDDGRFALPDLPPGEYVVEARHATLGTLSQSVSVGGAAAAEVHFVFEP